MKGLGKVIIRTKVQAAHPIAHVIAGREQDDRRIIAASPQLRQNREAVLAGQHDIEHYGVNRRRGKPLKGTFSIHSRLYLPPGKIERARKRFPNEPRVLHQQKPHASPPTMAARTISTRAAAPT